MLTKNVNVFVVKFCNEIKFHEVPLLRGAVLKLIGDDVEVLYHNHTDDSTFRYSYPLIQYKRIRGRAAVFCIADGTNAVGQLLSSESYDVMLGDRPVTLEIDSVSPRRNIVQTWDSEFRYYLRNWLPLNSQNYQEYRRLEGLAERVAFLENILVGNLLSFAKGVGIEVEGKIYCKLQVVEEPRIAKVKGVKVMSFDVQFCTNMSLPDYMGLGKHVSIGYGTVARVRSREGN